MKFDKQGQRIITVNERLGFVISSDFEKINDTLLELWHEVQIYYGDIQKKENELQFLTRIQQKYFPTPNIPQPDTTPSTGRSAEEVDELIMELALDLYSSPHGKANPETFAFIAGYKYRDSEMAPLQEYALQNPSKEDRKENKEPKLQQVWRKKDGRKFVVFAKELEEIKKDPGQYEYICSKPHEDGDFSYMCAFNHCRCSS